VRKVALPHVPGKLSLSPDVIADSRRTRWWSRARFGPCFCLL